MTLLLKFSVASVVNIPLFSYLTESFFGGKDANENITTAFGIILLLIYSFQLLLIILFTWRKVNIKQAYSLLFLLLLLALIGIFNSNSIIYTIICFLQYLSVILFSIWLAGEPADKIKSLIIYSFYSCFLGFVLFSVLHFYLSNGDFLFTLAQIQLPAFFLLFLCTNNILSIDRKNKLLLYLTVIIYLLILFLGAFRATDLQQYRLQFLPVGLFLMIVTLLLPKYFFIIFLGILIFNLVYNNQDILEILLFRLGSFEERVSIIQVMANESFYFIIPQGLGSSNRLFDINSLTIHSESTRSLFPPHSGFAAMLYDSSIIFFIFVFIFYFNLIKRIKHQNLTLNTQDFFIKSRIPFWSIFILIYLFENIFYLKFSITGATFSDDFLYVFILIIFFQYKTSLTRIFK